MLPDENRLLACHLHVLESTTRHPSEDASGFHVDFVPFLVDAPKHSGTCSYLHHTPPETPERVLVVSDQCMVQLLDLRARVRDVVSKTLSAFMLQLVS